jgi:hypothetical protein
MTQFTWCTDGVHAAWKLVLDEGQKSILIHVQFSFTDKNRSGELRLAHPPTAGCCQHVGFVVLSFRCIPRLGPPGRNGPVGEFYSGRMDVDDHNFHRCLAPYVKMI